MVKALVTLYHDLNETDKAVELLEGQLANHYDQVDLTHINMLADLYMATVRVLLMPEVLFSSAKASVYC